MSTYLAQPATYVAMDHETDILHLVAMWIVEGPRAFKALERAALDGAVPLNGETFLTCVLEGPDVVTMRLDGRDEWVSVVARQDGLDTLVEVRSRGLRAQEGDVSAQDRARFEQVVSMVARALDEVMSPVWARGSR
ncbi:MAG: hypothetical protein U1E26_08740 [Coriobacteriia bacterium]|nr:hypothetical protein [Coriobacteriia bacterium]